MEKTPLTLESIYRSIRDHEVKIQTLKRKADEIIRFSPSQVDKPLPVAARICRVLKLRNGHPVSIREIRGNLDGVPLSTIRWTLSRLSNDRKSGVQRLEHGIYSYAGGPSEL